MNTVDVNCNLCGTDDYAVVYNSTLKGVPPTVEDYTSTVNRYGLYHRIVSCRKCGLIYMNPRDAGTKDLYQEVVDQAYVESSSERARTFKKHLDILGKYVKKGGEILDVGCCTGIFLNEAKNQGYRVTGIEASKWAAGQAREKCGAQVLAGSWEDVTLPEDHFDAVTMWDVLEHLEDPAACLQQAQRWLKKNGVVAITTHDINSRFAKALGKRYPWLMRFHLYHFTPGTLTTMLSQNGFKPIALSYYEKTFSLEYIFRQIGAAALGRFFKNIRVSLNMGDMFMLIAEKK